MEVQMSSFRKAGCIDCNEVVSKKFVGPLTGAVTGAVLGNLTGNVTGYIILPTYTVAQLPTPASGIAGMLVRCSNGDAGAATVAMCDGSAWKVIDLGATCSAT
jgi:hypothetical protein